MYGGTGLNIDLGKEAIKLGSSYVNRAVITNAYMNRIRKYFQVDSFYVLKKLVLILFPYNSSSWRASSKTGGFSSGMGGVGFHKEEHSHKGAGARSEAMEIQDPDLYMPLMAATTYVMTHAAEMGLKGQFHPEKLGVLVSRIVMISCLEITVIKVLGFFFEANELEFLDMVSFTGYKYIPSILAKLSRALLTGAARNLLVIYLYAAFLVFLARSLKSFLVIRGAIALVKQKRIYFLFIIVFLDSLIMLFLK
jgi:protein transport protein YIF1